MAACPEGPSKDVDSFDDSTTYTIPKQRSEGSLQGTPETPTFPATDVLCDCHHVPTTRCPLHRHRSDSVGDLLNKFCLPEDTAPSRDRGAYELEFDEREMQLKERFLALEDRGAGSDDVPDAYFLNFLDDETEEERRERELRHRRAIAEEENRMAEFEAVQEIYARASKRAFRRLKNLPEPPPGCYYTGDGEDESDCYGCGEDEDEQSDIYQTFGRGTEWHFPVGSSASSPPTAASSASSKLGNNMDAAVLRKLRARGRQNPRMLVRKSPLTPEAPLASSPEASPSPVLASNSAVAILPVPPSRHNSITSSDADPAAPVAPDPAPTPATPQLPPLPTRPQPQTP
eukprot:Sspe_Gene.72876::Locus_43678_Transcript_2_5_Confidence_0.273_Length_1302::g.72876::m.72876